MFAFAPYYKVHIAIYVRYIIHGAQWQYRVMTIWYVYVQEYVTDILKHTKPKPKSKYNLMEETPLYMHCLKSRIWVDFCITHQPSSNSFSSSFAQNISWKAIIMRRWFRKPKNYSNHQHAFQNDGKYFQWSFLYASTMYRYTLHYVYMITCEICAGCI